MSENLPLECEECKEPLIPSPSGAVCPNGHGCIKPMRHAKETIKKEVQCPECLGEGVEPCPHCGTEIDCEECGGKGRVMQDVEVEESVPDFVDGMPSWLLMA